MWLVKFIIFDKWNMIFEYIVLYELWNINVYELNMIYLCFIKFYIKFGIFHITAHGPARSTFGPRAFRAGPARKSAHGPCLGRQAGTMAYEGTARWPAGHTGPCLIVPCLARARAVPCRAGLARWSSNHFDETKFFTNKKLNHAGSTLKHRAGPKIVHRGKGVF